MNIILALNIITAAERGVRHRLALWVGAFVILFLGLSEKAFAADLVSPMPVISHQAPTFVSGTTPGTTTTAANDGNPASMWVSSGIPAWIAYDLSGVPAAQRHQVLAAWYAPWAVAYAQPAPTPDAQLPINYTIEINAAPGGTLPSTGWQQVVSVTGNTHNTGQHLFNLAEANWVRLSVTASSNPTSIAIDFDIHSAPNGESDSWLFMGDSITGMAVYIFSEIPSLVHGLAPDRWPVSIGAGLGGTNSGTAGDVIDANLASFTGHYVILAYGTNDGNVPSFFTNMESLVLKIIAAGKIPVIPHMPWSSIPDIQAKAPGINAQIDALYLKYPIIRKGPDLWSAFMGRTDWIPVGDVHPNDAGNHELRRLWAVSMTSNSQPASGVSINLTPISASLSVGASTQFTAVVSGSNTTAVTWSIQEGNTGGTVTSTGLYTAPSVAGTYHVVAVSAADPSKLAVATVTVAAINGGSGGPTPIGSWVNLTSNLAGMASECGTLSYISAKPDQDMLIACVSAKGLWASTDGAATWAPLGASNGGTVVNNRTSAIVYDPANSQVFWESGIYGNLQAYKTTNNGLTFSAFPTNATPSDVQFPFHSDSLSVDFTDPSRKTIVVGAHETPNKVIRSTDGGLTWTNIGASVPSALPSNHVLVLNAQTYLLGCADNSSGAIFRTTNGGQSWIQVSTGGGMLTPLRASDGRIYWLSSDGLRRSDDQGQTWISLATGNVLRANPGFNAASPIELPNGSIAALGANNEIKVSADHGATWIAATTPLVFPDSRFGPVVTYSSFRKAFYVSNATCENQVRADAIFRFGYDATTSLPPVITPVSVSISPGATSIQTGTTAQFAAAVSGSNDSSVTWKVQEGSAGGTVSSTGLYTAPSAAGTYHVVATSNADSTKSATATVTATAPVMTVSITLSPVFATLPASTTTQFTAAVGGSTNTSVTWKVQEGSAGGTVSSTGLYTAPSAAGTYHVVATSNADSTKSATATVTVTAPVTTVSITLSPVFATLPGSTTTQFTATVGGSTNTSVTWSIQEGNTGGAVSASGLYTAPSAAGNYHVVATSVADPSKSAVSSVTVTTNTGGGGSGGVITPTGSWVNLTSNLAGMASECGTISYLSAKPDQDMLIAGVSAKGLWASTDGAASWFPLGTGAGSEILTSRPSMIVYDPTNPQTYWESGIFGSLHAYKTANNGLTFSSFPTNATPPDVQYPFHNASISLDFTDPLRKTILLGGQGVANKVLRSIDGGLTWTNIGATVPSALLSSQVLVVNAQTYLLGCSDNSVSAIFRTSNGGQTWIQVSGSGGMRSPLRASDGRIYWLASNGSLVRSDDQGQTWTSLATGGVLRDNPSFMAASPIELPNGGIAALGAKNEIKVSMDHGATWNAVTTPLVYSDSRFDQHLAYSSFRKAFYLSSATCEDQVRTDAIYRFGYDATVTSPGTNVSVLISPLLSTLTGGATDQFIATVMGSTNTGVTWGIQEGITGGTISATGLYTAPLVAGTYHVVATSQADPTKTAVAPIMVSVSAPSITVTISPQSTNLALRGKRQFTATVTGTATTGVTWSIQEGSTGGSITTAGLYTAPARPGVFHVQAKSKADPSKTAVATVTVASSVSVSISPTTASVQVGGTRQFTASIGNTTNTAVTWSIQEAATGGTISNTGLFTAPTVAGTYHVVAQSSADTTKSASAVVTVTSLPTAPVITSFTASPAAIVAGTSATLSWNVAGATSVSISPSVGAVSGTSVSVSPTATTTYTLTATNGAGTVTKTTSVTVTPAPLPPVITSFTASPATIGAGTSATLSWNVAGATGVSISPSVGTVSGTSVSVSPTVTTTYTLTATNAAGNVTKNTSITVTPAPALPSIASFGASPSSISAGGSSNLSWSVTGATSLSISPSVGAVSGTGISVSPTATTNYILTATNSVGSISSTLTVTVGTSPPLAKAPVVRILRDDQVATLEMDFNADNNWGQWWPMTGSGKDDAGFLVTWWPDGASPAAMGQMGGCMGCLGACGKPTDALAVSKFLVTGNRRVQIQPLANNAVYHVCVERINSLGEVTSLRTEMTFNGGDSTRVDALRASLTHFDDFNLPMGPADEKLWNNASSTSTDPRFNLFFINDQFHAHSLNGTLMENTGDKSQTAQRFRRPIAIENGVRRRVVFDMDSPLSPRSVWYLDFNPIADDLTGHANFFDEDGAQGLPAGVLRLRSQFQTFTVDLIGMDGASHTIASADMEALGRQAVSNVRRAFDVRVGTDGITVDIDGKRLIDATFPAGAFAPGDYSLLWNAFGYNTPKDNNPYYLVHWDNFGFDGPVREPRTVHNYVTRIAGTDYQKSQRWNSTYPTFTIKIPDDLKPTVDNATAEAWLVYTYQMGDYSQLNLLSSDSVQVNGGKAYSLPPPINNSSPSNPALLVWGLPHTARIKLGDITKSGVSPLAVGDNTFKFFADNAGLLNAHVEVFYPAGSEPAYTPPGSIHPVPMHADLPKLGPPARFEKIGATQINRDAYNLDDPANLVAPVSGVVSVNVVVGNDSYADWAPDLMVTPIRSEEVWSTGGTNGISTVELFLRPAGTAGTDPGNRVALIQTNRDAPAPQGRYTMQLDTRGLPNGNYQLFVLATTPTGLKSHPKYNGVAQRWEASLLAGAYYPITIKVQN